ncbi:type II toxin-antitoxin system VapC family toxin [Falsiroseomonas sp. E2-1-a4]|uniref:type II toxin-antitoxin system VapC family toxin n=1 Tax=Falsiroseomonas sp. E2-1-a4 TaxID=3239299 RepID=UPI003F2FB3F6
MAILRQEPEAERFTAMLAEAPEVAVSAATLLELGMVAESQAGPAIRPRMDQLLADTGAEVVPFTEAQARLALEAWRRFGKGRHKAALNFGDCFAYALARERNASLLFKGADFSETDVKAAI